MLNPLGQNQRRPTGASGVRHVLADHPISDVIGHQLTAEASEFTARVGLGFSSRAKTCRPHEHTAGKRLLNGLIAAVGPIPHGTAVQTHDRMVAVLAHNRCRQPRNVLRLGAAHHQLKAACRHMVAFVHDQEAVVGHSVVHLALLHQALHQSNVQHSRKLFAPSAQTTDAIVADVQKFPQPVEPLLKQLLAMHNDQCVDPSLGDQPCGHHRLAERCGGSQNPGVMGQHGLRCHFLIWA